MRRYSPHLYRTSARPLDSNLILGAYYDLYVIVGDDVIQELPSYNPLTPLFVKYEVVRLMGPNAA